MKSAIKTDSSWLYFIIPIVLALVIGIAYKFYKPSSNKTSSNLSTTKGGGSTGASQSSSTTNKFVNAVINARKAGAEGVTLEKLRATSKEFIKEFSPPRSARFHENQGSSITDHFTKKTYPTSGIIKVFSFNEKYRYYLVKVQNDMCYFYETDIVLINNVQITL